MQGMPPFVRPALLLCAALSACAPTTREPAAPSPPAAATPPRWEVRPGWAHWPADFGPTHGGLAFDRAGRLWTGTDGPHGIVAFAPDGTVAAEIPALSGTHSLLLRDEGGEELLYVAHLRAHRVVKVRLDGTELWEIATPMESGAYEKPEQFQPTAVAVAPDGRLYVADGYGRSLIHEFDAQRKWVRCFAGLGDGPGLCSTPHGLAIDTRFGAPRLLVCDRENRRLVHFDLDGNYLGVHATGLRRPCGVVFVGDRALVAELEGGVALVDRDGKVLERIGDNPAVAQRANYEVPPSDWSPQVLCAPHAVALDARGDLYVLDWSRAGRVSRFARTD